MSSAVEYSGIVLCSLLVLFVFTDTEDGGTGTSFSSTFSQYSGTSSFSCCVTKCVVGFPGWNLKVGITALCSGTRWFLKHATQIAVAFFQISSINQDTFS